MRHEPATRNDVSRAPSTTEVARMFLDLPSHEEELRLEPPVEHPTVRPVAAREGAGLVHPRMRLPAPVHPRETIPVPSMRTLGRDAPVVPIDDLWLDGP